VVSFIVFNFEQYFSYIVAVSFIGGGNRRTRSVVAVIAWWQFDFQLPLQTVPITTDVVGSTPAQCEVYNIM
jgi:hypothetical protein